MYDKRDDFNFKIVYVPFNDGDFHHFPSYGGVYIRSLFSLRVFVLMLVTSTIEPNSCLLT